MRDGGFTILVVCQGNIHRSALGAVLLRTWADWYLPADVSAQVVVGSAGLGAPEGEPMRGPARRLARALGADPASHRARQITDQMIEGADLILTASRRQRDKTVNRVPAALRRTFTMREAARLAPGVGAPTARVSASMLRQIVDGLASQRRMTVGDRDDDIVDPNGRGEDVFRQMARQEVPSLAAVAALLFGMPPADVEAYAAAVERADVFSGDE